jgi:malonyl-CoA O-methyltransferase
MSHIFNQPITQPAKSLQSLPVVFLPGWGFDGTIITLMEYIPPWIYPRTVIDPKTLVSDLYDFFEKKEISKAVLVGWSMGAHLALDFARAYPDRVAGLKLIALRSRWPDEEIEALRADLLTDQNEFLKIFYRKCFLGNREAYKRFAKILQHRYLEGADAAILRNGLEYLKGTVSVPTSGQFVLQIHGTDDIIAPLAEMAVIPGATVERVARAGHLPFLSPHCSIAASNQKQVICRRFSKAVATYDENALLQKELAGRLAEEISNSVDVQVTKRILEIGCGTGVYTKLLADRFPQAEILALDFSRQMIAAAKEKMSGTPRVRFLCEDGEAFLAEGSRGETFDLITSNATLQWFAGLETAFRNMKNVLRPGGLLVASVFGAGSLKELGCGLTEIFGKEIGLAAQHFPDLAMLQQAAKLSFAAFDIERKIIGRCYPSSLELLRQLKKTGTTGSSSRKLPTLSRARLAALDQWFADSFQACKVSYEVFLLKYRR